mmetsp:Transcript_5869/g.19502  ORF Transcript_5869/g.19502 Transcript_5869/m.19502 type:complete len:252 (-) Transcript_5869:656-1411(-)
MGDGDETKPPGEGAKVMSDATFRPPIATDSAPRPCVFLWLGDPPTGLSPAAALLSHALSFPSPGAARPGSVGPTDLREFRPAIGAQKRTIVSVRSPAAAATAAPPLCTTKRLCSSRSITIFLKAGVLNTPAFPLLRATRACSRTYLNGACLVRRTATPFSENSLTNPRTAWSTSSAVAAGGFGRKRFGRNPSPSPPIPAPPRFARHASVSSASNSSRRFASRSRDFTTNSSYASRASWNQAGSVDVFSLEL